MTENELRRSVTELAEQYAKSGAICEWSSGLDRLIKIYNDHRPLARGYKYVKEGGWCMLFVSVLFIETGLADLIQTEVGPWEAIQADKAAGRFREPMKYIPKPGDLVYYYYQNKDASGKVTNAWFHVGLCTNADETVVFTTEGNVEDRVLMLAHKPDDKSIYGYCAPDYASKASSFTFEGWPDPPKKNGTYTPAVVVSNNEITNTWKQI